MLALCRSASRLQTEKGLFSRCQDKMIAGGVAKAYLVSLLGGEVDVELNDGRCVVNESETSYYFNTSRKTSECGTRRLVSGRGQERSSCVEETDWSTWAGTWGELHKLSKK